jgi:hypothetical protein
VIKEIHDVKRLMGFEVPEAPPEGAAVVTVGDEKDAAARAPTPVPAAASWHAPAAAGDGGAAEAAMERMTTAILAELREVKAQVADIRKQVTGTKAMAAQVVELRQQLSSQQVLTAQMLELRHTLVGGAGAGAAWAPAAAPAPAPASLSPPRATSAAVRNASPADGGGSRRPPREAPPASAQLPSWSLDKRL